MSIKPVDEKHYQFMDYLAENYIYPQSDFHRNTWAEISSKQTTNASILNLIRVFTHLIRKYIPSYKY